MQNTRNKFLLFSVGAFGYGIIEILWRGYTHWSMLCAGGICFTLFARIGEKMRNATLFIKAVAGGITVTAIELIFGIIFNIILKKNVWDYSALPFNIGGQICLLYSLFWSILSIIFIPLASSLNRKLKFYDK